MLEDLFVSNCRSLRILQYREVLVNGQPGIWARRVRSPRALRGVRLLVFAPLEELAMKEFQRLHLLRLLSAW